MKDDEPYIVFVPRPTPGFTESKRGGLWWRRVVGWGAAEAVKEHAGEGAWMKSVDEMAEFKSGKHRLAGKRYPRPSIQEAWARRQERSKALDDFASGADSPPWEE